MEQTMQFGGSDNDYHWMLNHGYLKAFATRECRELLEMVQHIQVQDGDLLFGEGERSNQLYVIREGNVAIGHRTAPGQWLDWGPFGAVNLEEEKPTDRWKDRLLLGEGDCLGVEGCLSGMPHDHSAMAVGETNLLSLNSHQFRHLARHHPQLCHCFADGLRRAWRTQGHRQG
ncbi:MAG: cyclic nucleotide-binding domain-containing protein [Magnetococcales bacterium]|nr:cyclic nucleotide-binding domain-containing protein [Magnetococcales bacterium]